MITFLVDCESSSKGIQAVEEYEGKINGTLNLGTLYAIQSKKIGRRRYSPFKMNVELV